MRGKLWFLCWAVLWPVPAAGQLVEQPPSIQALAISEDDAPMLDGRVDEPIWLGAPIVSDFRQREPQEGQPATEPTQVRILYSPSALYFGVICYDSNPRAILATEMQRDNPLDNDDVFTVLLDTFHDHRNAFLFRTNALGTKFDAVITDEQRLLNVEWDEKWYTAASIGEEGWSVEIEIPWKTLRSQSEKVQTWGIDFERMVRRKAEEDYWASYSQDFEFWTVSQYGHLENLEEVRAGLKLRLKPYGIGGFNQVRDDDQNLELGDEFDGGMENVKLSVTPSVTADFAINPDFAQAEVDQSIFNITRFSLFFPEKREFFLERAGIFNFGPVGGDFSSDPDMLVFFSRRIGLSQEGAPIPIMAGGRVTGDVSNFTFGALNAQTRSLGLESATNFGVVRVQRKLLQRSYLGGIFTNKSVSNGGGLNRVAGVDANFVFFDKLRLFGMFAKSSTDGVSDQNAVEGLGDHLTYQAAVDWTSDLWTAEGNRTRIDDNFDPQVGFVRREGITRDRLDFRWRPRPKNSKIIRQYWFSSEHEWFRRQKGFLETRANSLFLGAILKGSDLAGVSMDNLYEFLDEPFEIAPDVTIPRGGYHFRDLRLSVRSSSGRRISGGVRATYGEFFDGRIVGATFTPIVKINQNLSVEPSYSFNDVSLPAGDFTSRVVNARVNYNFSTKLLTSTTIQHNNIGGGFLFNWRFNYVYRPGDDLFIVYRETRDLDDPRGALLGRTLLVKFTHSFDF